MSEEISKLPPYVQERLLRFQQLQQTLQTVLTQKHQVELELNEIEQALTELQKIEEGTTIYKSIGSLLVEAKKVKVTDDLKNRKELLNTRITVLGKQEERLRGQLKELQGKLQKDLGPISTT